MMLAKRKVSLTLDADLVAELETADQALSSQVNQALRNELDRRRDARLLAELLDKLDAQHGPVDEALIAKYTALLT
jgi:Post-segregation antitoxin CcdA